MIKKGTRLYFRPEFCDGRENDYPHHAVDDEYAGRVLVASELPGWSFRPTEVVKTLMLTKEKP